MSPALVAALDASLAGMLQHVGTPAEYCPASGSVVPCDVSFAELADGIDQRPHGHDRVRLADVLLRRAVLAADPRHGDRIIVNSGPQAGDWVVLGIERQDEAAIVVRVRQAARVDAAAPGSREVRR